MGDAEMKTFKIALAAALLAFAGEASAADLTTPVEPVVAPVETKSPDWRFQATIYGWLSGVDGNVGIAGLGPVDIDVTPGDAIQKLKGALMASFGGDNGDWMFLTDFMATRIGDDSQIGQTRFNYDYTQTQITVQGILGYILPINVPNLSLAATAGFRYQNLNGDLAIGTDRFPNLREASGTVQWIDPTVGLSAHYDFNDRWFVNLIGDVGGFGVGSNFTWQAFGALGYNWTKTISTSIGYRAIYEDYESGGFVYDTTQQGVFAGLGIHF